MDFSVCLYRPLCFSDWKCRQMIRFKRTSFSSDCSADRRYSDIYSDLSTSPFSLCITLRRTLYLVRFTTEWSIYQLFLVPRNTQDESSIYAHDFLYTGVAIDCACVLALPRISPSSRNSLDLHFSSLSSWKCHVTLSVIESTPW